MQSDVITLIPAGHLYDIPPDLIILNSLLRGISGLSGALFLFTLLILNLALDVETLPEDAENLRVDCLLPLTPLLLVGVVVLIVRCVPGALLRLDVCLLVTRGVFLGERPMAILLFVSGGLLVFDCVLLGLLPEYLAI